MKGYELIEKDFDGKIKFYFISTGKRNVIKTVEFVHLIIFDNLEVYNLGFGDFDGNTDSLIDHSYTGNGDERKVLNTVLTTIPKFLSVVHQKW